MQPHNDKKTQKKARSTHDPDEKPRKQIKKNDTDKDLRKKYKKQQGEQPKKSTQSRGRPTGKAVRNLRDFKINEVDKLSMEQTP